MNADLYIDNRSFSYIESDTVQNIAVKIANFAELVCFLVPKKQDRFLVRENDFYSTVLMKNCEKNITIYDFFFGTEECSEELRDAKEQLLAVISNIENTELDEDKFIDLINCKASCSALVVMNKFDDGRIPNERQIVSTKQGWYEFHRDYLVRNCQDSDFFLSETKLYFENLVLHDDNRTSIKKVLKSHISQIVYCLSCLNDSLIDEFVASSENDFRIFLDAFRIKHRLDGASFEGEKRDEFKKCFYINGKNTECYCESHLKIFTDDNKKNCHCRIYFKVPQKKDAKIYIGIITNHI